MEDKKPTAYEAGLLNRRRILGDAWVDRSLENRNGFNAEFQEMITVHAWNDIWGRPALGDRTRRFMVLSMMLGITPTTSSRCMCAPRSTARKTPG